MRPHSKRWIGVYVGEVWSSEILKSGSGRRSLVRNAITRGAITRVPRGPAESKILRTHRNSTRENREVPSLSVVETPADRWEKAMSYKAHLHGGGKSSDCIVPTKCANKGGGPSAERMEGRRSAEETSRHGPMLDTAPENIGALQCRGNACSRYRLGAERSEVGTVCVKRASTGLCGGQPATAVPTATPALSPKTFSALF